MLIGRAADAAGVNRDEDYEDKRAGGMGFAYGNENLNRNYEQAKGDSELERQLSKEEEGMTMELDADDIQTCDAKIAQMHPLSETPVPKLFPVLCCLFKCFFGCCISDKTVFDEEMQAAEEQKRDEIADRNLKLNDICKLNKGKYEGSNFTHDAEKHAGLNEGEESDDDNEHPLLTYGFGIDLWRK